MTWADWLHKEAEYGNADALRALRSRTGQADSDGNTLSGREDHEAIYRGLHVDVTKHGTIIVCAGSTILRDYGSKLAVTRGYQEDGLQVALRLASERYGGCLHVDGSEDFRERIVLAAAQGQLAISLDDPVLEARRLDLIHVATIKGDDHAIRKQPQQGRSAGRGISPDGACAGQRRSAGHTPSGSKPDIGGIGKVPPPESRNRLRAMPELGVFRVTGRSEVLLPGDVSGHVEQSGAATDHSVRRSVSGAGQLTLDLGPAAVQVSATAPRSGPKAIGHRHIEQLRPLASSASLPVLKGKARASVSEHEISAISASAKYVLEQEQERLSLPDIPKHLTYDGSQGLATFAGLRAVDGHQLALIQRANEILVVPVDDTTERRLARLSECALHQLQ